MASKRPSWITRTGPVSQAERERIIELAELGWPHWRTARDLGRHPSAVFHHYVVAGFVAATPTRRPSYQRGGRTVRSFSAAEDAFIEALSARGLNNSQISRQVAARFGQRNPATIKYRLCMLAALREQAAA